MRDIFKFEKRPNYPHMSVADTAIWHRFIDKYPSIFSAVQYDFHIGDAPPFNTLMDDGEDKNQDMLYRLRIDVVGEDKDKISIIELKPSAGVNTIGQVESYKTLYQRDEETKKPVVAVIVTDKENPNMAYLCKQKGVFLIVV